MSTPTSDLASLVQAYLALYPQEEPALHDFVTHLHQGDASIFSRATLPGHITAGGFIIAKDTQRVLLIEHAFLQLFLQPGGHYDPEDHDPLDAARRETLEETGLDAADLTYVPLKAEQPLIPFDIEVQPIPANPRKQEAAHKHYDFRYIFMVSHEADVHIQTEESATFRWTDWRVFAAGEPGFQQVAKKVEHLHLFD